MKNKFKVDMLLVFIILLSGYSIWYVYYVLPNSKYSIKKSLDTSLNYLISNDCDRIKDIKVFNYLCNSKIQIVWYNISAISLEWSKAYITIKTNLNAIQNNIPITIDFPLNIIMEKNLNKWEISKIDSNIFRQDTNNNNNQNGIYQINK